MNGSPIGAPDAHPRLARRPAFRAGAAASAAALLTTAWPQSVGAQAADGPVAPRAGTWRPWLLASGSQLRPPPPPDRAATEAELRELKALVGQRDGAALDRIRFWDAGPAPYRWTEALIEWTQVRTFLANGPLWRAFALVTAAMADATIAAWDAKYAYQRPRPTEQDPSLTAAVAVPRSPSYPSEHAAAAGAAAAVLGYLFPADAGDARPPGPGGRRVPGAGGRAVPQRRGRRAGPGAPGRRPGARAGPDRQLGRHVGRRRPQPGRGCGPGRTRRRPGARLEAVGARRARPAAARPAAGLRLGRAGGGAGRGEGLPPHAPHDGAGPQLAVRGLRQLGGDRALDPRGQPAPAGGAAATPTRPGAARLYALLSVGLYDTWIATQEAKFHYWTARPNQLDPPSPRSSPPPTTPRTRPTAPPWGWRRRSWPTSSPREAEPFRRTAARDRGVGPLGGDPLPQRHRGRDAVGPRRRPAPARPDQGRRLSGRRSPTIGGPEAGGARTPDGGETAMRHCAGAGRGARAAPWPPRAAHGAVPLEHARVLHWLLRLACVLEFVGHGAFGVITKPAWVAYYGRGGDPPRVGLPADAPDRGRGHLPGPPGAAQAGARRPALHGPVGAVDGPPTPPAGEPVWETIERAPNYLVPAAFLALRGLPAAWGDWRGWLR